MLNNNTILLVEQEKRKQPRCHQQDLLLMNYLFGEKGGTYWKLPIFVR